MKLYNPQSRIPPLQNGERLSRPEFERRYQAMPHAKAELIAGRVFMAAALRFKQHGKPHSQLVGWLFNYQIATPGTELADNTTVCLDLENAPQPDAVLFLAPEVGGQMRISADDYLEGAPDLIAEVAASSAAYDLGEKKRIYQRNGVKEYLVWQIFENRLDWFILQDGEYQLLEPNPDGILCSPTFPGLWLDIEALLNNNLVQVTAVLHQGLQSQDHQDFLGKLHQA